jgi:hypothetical protein
MGIASAAAYRGDDWERSPGLRYTLATHPLTMRHDFNQDTIRELARRVNAHCSRCDAATQGPHTTEGKSVNVGVACHINAASPEGPRYDPLQTEDERRSIENGIYLCQTCSKLVDNDPGRFPAGSLREMKREAETNAAARLGRSGPADSRTEAPPTRDEEGYRQFVAICTLPLGDPNHAEARRLSAALFAHLGGDDRARRIATLAYKRYLLGDAHSADHDMARKLVDEVTPEHLADASWEFCRWSTVQEWLGSESKRLANAGLVPWLWVVKHHVPVPAKGFERCAPMVHMGVQNPIPATSEQTRRVLEVLKKLPIASARRLRKRLPPSGGP